MFDNFSIEKATPEQRQIQNGNDNDNEHEGNELTLGDISKLSLEEKAEDISDIKSSLQAV